MGPLAGDGASRRPEAASNHAGQRPQNSAANKGAPFEGLRGRDLCEYQRFALVASPSNSASFSGSVVGNLHAKSRQT